MAFSTRRQPSRPARDEARRKRIQEAIRQLERAELYVVAVQSLEVGDREAESTLLDVLSRMKWLRSHLADLDGRISGYPSVLDGGASASG